MTSTAIDLGEFLRQQGEDGAIDSSGEFTVDKDQAARKLARFALPTPFSWVLKVVQAAVCWQADSLVVTQTRLNTTISFCPREPGRLPEIKELIRTLVSGNVGGTAPEERLSIALRAIVEQSGFSFLLVLHNGQESHSLFAGNDFSKMSEPLRNRLAVKEAPGIRLVVSLLRGEESVTGRIFGGYLIAHRERYLDLARELETASSLAPMPVTLDGRRLDGVLNHPAHGFSESRRPLILSGVDLPDARPLPVPEEFEEKIMSARTHPRRATRTYHGRRGFSAWFILSVGMPGQSLERSSVPYHWLQDGVIVESKHIDLMRATESCRLELFLNAEGLQTDLTGLRLVESQEKTRRLQSAFQEVTRKLEELARDPFRLVRMDEDEKTYEDHRYDQLQKSRQRARQFALTVPTLAATLVFPIVGSVATLGVGALVYMSQLTAEDFSLNSYYEFVRESLPKDAKLLCRKAQRWKPDE